MAPPSPATAAEPTDADSEKRTGLAARLRIEISLPFPGPPNGSVVALKPGARLRLRVVARSIGSDPVPVFSSFGPSRWRYRAALELRLVSAHGAPSRRWVGHLDNRVFPVPAGVVRLQQGQVHEFERRDPFRRFWDSHIAAPGRYTVQAVYRVYLDSGIPEGGFPKYRQWLPAVEESFEVGEVRSNLLEFVRE